MAGDVCDVIQNLIYASLLGSGNVKNDMKHRVEHFENLQENISRSQYKTIWMLFVPTFDLQRLKPITIKPKEANMPADKKIKTHNVHVIFYQIKIDKLEVNFQKHMSVNFARHNYSIRICRPQSNLAIAPAFSTAFSASSMGGCRGQN